MRLQPIAFALATLTNAASLYAQEAPSVKSPHSVSANAGLVSDYRFRGISQNWRRPAFQAGADYSHASGWYAGIWGSQVSENMYPGASLEIDLYGGYKHSFANGVGLNAGLLRYTYPGGRYRPAPGVAAQRFDTLEALVDVFWRGFGVKYSRTLGDYFGVNATSALSPSFCADSSPALPCSPGVPVLPVNGSSRGSGYLDLYGSVELGDGYTLGLHAGRQEVRNYRALGFTDVRLQLSKEFAGNNVLLAYTNTNANRSLYHYSDIAGSSFRQLAGPALTVSVSRTF